MEAAGIHEFWAPYTCSGATRASALSSQPAIVFSEVAFSYLNLEGPCRTNQPTSALPPIPAPSPLGERGHAQGGCAVPPVFSALAAKRFSPLTAAGSVY